MGMLHITSPFVMLLAVLLLACTATVNPATGRREIVLMSTEDEQRIDQEANREIASSMGLVPESPISRYVKELGARLARFSPRQDLDYHFQIVEMDEPNAFALPGGHIYISRGLLLLASTEAELAHVLGHEIAHVAARHAARSDAHIKTLGIATLISELMSGSSTHPDDEGDRETAGSHPIARYARNHERQADRIGQDIASAAKIEPGGMARFLTALDNYTKLDQGFSMPQSYFSTHPATRERMADAAARAQTESWRIRSKDAAPGFPSYSEARGAYLDRIEGMPVTRPAREGVIQGNRFLHPDLDFGLRFPHGWEPHNGATSVAAVSPKRDGLLILEMDGPGSDPVAAARAYSAREDVPLRGGAPLSIGALPAYRAEAVLRAPYGTVRAEVTWIAYKNLVYRITGGVRGGPLKRYQGLFRKFAQSFRPLTPEERASIRERRLRTTRALPGETLLQLSARSGNQWDPTFTAVVNGVFAHEALEPGQRLKIAVDEPYEPEPVAAKPGSEPRP